MKKHMLTYFNRASKTSFNKKYCAKSFRETFVSNMLANYIFSNPIFNIIFTKLRKKYLQ